MATPSELVFSVHIFFLFICNSIWMLWVYNVIFFNFPLKQSPLCSPLKLHFFSLFLSWEGKIDSAIFFFSSPERVRWAIAITWRPSSSSVCRKLFQKSSPLKVLEQWKPNLVWIITRVSSYKIVSGDTVHHPTWPLLLEIEHMVKLQVLGNNSKTVNNIKNLTWIKLISTSRSTYPAILK